MNVRPIPRDPSLPIVPALAPWVAEYCECPRPIPRERAERLQNLTAALTRAVTQSEILDAVLAEISRALGSAFCGITLLDDDGETFTFFPDAGVPPEVAAAWRRFPVARNTRASVAVRTRLPNYANTRADFVGGNNPALESLAESLHIESSAVLPLIAGDRMLGALVLAFGVPRQFTS